MVWFVAGLLFALFNAGTMLVNQKYKLDGSLISGMRGVGVALIYSPAALFVPFPKSHLFWWLIVAEGLLSAFFSSRLYSASAKFGAGTTSRISMLAVPFGLVFWWIIDFAGFVGLVKTPSVLLGILASVAAICFSFKKMSAGSGGSGAQTSYLLPAVVVLAVMMIVRKEAMAEADFASAAVYYPLCAIFISGSINLGVYAYSNGAGMLAAQLRTHHVLAGGISMAVVSSLTIFTGNLASLYVPDPAYLSALTLTSPLWIMLYNACFGIRDVVEKRWVIAMLLSLCALMFFAQMPLSSPSEIPSTAGHRG